MSQEPAGSPPSGPDPRSLVVRFVSDPEDRVVPPSGAGIGRAPSNELAVPEKLGFMVSGKHARLLIRDGAWWITDQDSTNGTFVNGEQIIGMKRLRDGDRVSFGPEGLEGAILMTVVSGAGARGARPAPRPSAGETPEPPANPAPAGAGTGSPAPAPGPGAPAADPGGGWNPFKKISQKIERHKTRKELQREQRELESQLPVLDGARATACATLGMQAAKNPHCESLASGESVADAVQAVADLHAAVTRAEAKAAALSKSQGTILAKLQSDLDRAKKDEQIAVEAFTGASGETEKAAGAVRATLGPHIESLKSTAALCTDLVKSLEGTITEEVLARLIEASGGLGRAAELARTRPPGLDKATAALTSARTAETGAAQTLEQARALARTAEKTLSDAKSKAASEAGDAQRETQAAREQAVAAEQTLSAKYQALGEEALAARPAWAVSLPEFAGAEGAAASAEQVRGQIRELQERMAALG